MTLDSAIIDHDAQSRQPKPRRDCSVVSLPRGLCRHKALSVARESNRQHERSDRRHEHDREERARRPARVPV